MDVCVPANELQVLSDDCRYLVLLAKIQSKVEKKEEALLSLERVSASASVLLETVCIRSSTELTSCSKIHTVLTALDTDSNDFAAGLL